MSTPPTPRRSSSVTLLTRACPTSLPSESSRNWVSRCESQPRPNAHSGVIEPRHSRASASSLILLRMCPARDDQPDRAVVRSSAASLPKSTPRRKKPIGVGVATTDASSERGGFELHPTRVIAYTPCVRRDRRAIVRLGEHHQDEREGDLSQAGGYVTHRGSRRGPPNGAVVAPHCHAGGLSGTSAFVGLAAFSARILDFPRKCRIRAVSARITPPVTAPTVAM